MQVLARALARGVGAGVVTLDCPGHGERRPPGRDGATRFGDRQVLMTNMTHDEHFPIAGALEIFGLLPGPKRMGVWEGAHDQLSAEAMTDSLIRDVPEEVVERLAIP